MEQNQPKERRHHAISFSWELLIVLCVVAYSLIVLLGAQQYRVDARLFPYVVGGMALSVSIIYLIRMVMRSIVPPSEERARRIAGVATAPDTDHATPDEATGRVEPGPTGVSTHDTASNRPELDRALPARQWDMWLIVGASLIVFLVAGRYAFAMVLPVLFMRRLGRHRWGVTLATGAGLVAFTWALTEFLVRARLPADLGLLERFL